MSRLQEDVSSNCFTYRVHSGNGGALEVVPARRVYARPDSFETAFEPTEGAAKGRDAPLHRPIAYRISFIIADKNRSWIRGSKRSIRWVFGFANSEALRRGGLGKQCRGKEHEVELVWSKKSGKIKVYWNKHCMSRQTEASSIVDFSWNVGSGESLQIVENSQQRKGDMSQGYDLLIDGTSFSQLLTAGQLGRTVDQSNFLQQQQQDASEQRSPNETTEPHRIRSFEESDSLSEPSQTSGGSAGFRLSMAGLNSLFSFGSDSVVKDELHSEMYSPVLESLRQKLTKSLPQAEEMVSRAIMNAFFADTSSMQSTDSLSTFEPKDPYQFEVDHILEAYRWESANASNAASPADLEELALTFLQKQTDEIFLCIRNEELTSDQAARIVLSVAAVLGLPFAAGIPLNTVIIGELEEGTTKESLYEQVSKYGEVEATAIARLSPSFGLCRFIHEDAASRAVDAVIEKGALIGCTAYPTIALLRVNFYDRLVPLSRLQSHSANHESGEMLDSSRGAPPPPPPIHATPRMINQRAPEADSLLEMSPDCVMQHSSAEYACGKQATTRLGQRVGSMDHALIDPPPVYSHNDLATITMPVTASSF